MTDIILHALQALIGGLLVLWLRNDTVEQVNGNRLTRSIWVSLIVSFAAVLMGYQLLTSLTLGIAVVSWIIAIGLFSYVLTAPHGQTLRGPHQDIPAGEEDPIFETATFITDHNGGAGDKLGWPTWLVYNGLRYVLPLALLGVVLGNLFIGISGVLVVLGYWPIGHLLAPRLRTEPQFVGAFLCGTLIIGGL